MKSFRVTRVYVIQAQTKTEAIEKVTACPTDYLDFESVREVIPETKGWMSTLKAQLG